MAGRIPEEAFSQSHTPADEIGSTAHVSPGLPVLVNASVPRGLRQTLGSQRACVLFLKNP